MAVHHDAAGLQINRGIMVDRHHDAAVDLQAGGCGQVHARAQANGGHHQVTVDHFAVRQVRFKAVSRALQAIEHRAQVETRADAFQPGLHRCGCRRVQQGRHDLLTRCDQIDFIAAQDQIIGKLTADQASAKQQHPPFAGSGSAKARVVFQVVDRENQLSRIAFDRYAHGFCAPGQDQVAVGHCFLADPQTLVAWVDAADACMGAHLGLELLGHRARLGHAQAIGFLVLAKAGGEHGLGVGASVIGSDQQQWGLAVELAKLPGDVVTGQSCADDHDRCVHSLLLVVRFLIR